MNEQEKSLQDLSAIRSMMERSSRFISLSGLSGICAGVCALIGSIVAYPYVYGARDHIIDYDLFLRQLDKPNLSIFLNSYLFWIALATFIAAFISAFLFTWLKSKRQQIPLWGNAAKRVMINVMIPVLVGGIFLYRMLYFGTFGLVAPVCLIFYGLGLINASKYTLSEIRYLGYAQLVLGVINLGFIGMGLFFWAAGFGLMHIIYGAYMWWKYDRNLQTEEA